MESTVACEPLKVTTSDEFNDDEDPNEKQSANGVELDGIDERLKTIIKAIGRTENGVPARNVAKAALLSRMASE